MSYSKFQERFKDKSSLIDTSGISTSSCNHPIAKPKSIQLHDSVLRSSAKSIIVSNSASLESNLPIHKSIGNISDDADQSPISLSTKNKNYESLKQSLDYNFEKFFPATRKSRLKYKSPNGKVNKSLQEAQFVPYTIKDYDVIKPKEYYELGGLGPSQVGSSDWIKKKEISDKRVQYGANVYIINSKKLPLLPIQRKIQNSKAFKLAKKLENQQ